MEKRSHSANSTVGQRRRRWPSIKPALGSDRVLSACVEGRLIAGVISGEVRLIAGLISAGLARSVALLGGFLVGDDVTGVSIRRIRPR